MAVNNSIALDRPIYTVDTWKPGTTGYYSVDLASYLFEYQGAGNAWSLGSAEDGSVRFELRDGEQHWWDVSVGKNAERDELTTRGTVADTGVPIGVRYGMTIEPGAPNTAVFMVLSQMHMAIGDTTSGLISPFGVSLVGEQMSIDIAYEDENGLPQKKQLFLDPYNIDRGHEYEMDIRVTMDPTGETGRLVVIRDGVTLVDYAGPIGYAGQTGVHWTQGLYRDGAATETIAARFSDLVIETGGDVEYPDPADFVAAPTIAVETVYEAANGTAVVEVAGTAEANALVEIFNGKTLVGSGFADANGAYAVKVAGTGAGTHSLHAVAEDDAGHRSAVSQGSQVLVTDAKGLIAGLEKLHYDTSLDSIFVSDGQAITVGSAADLYALLRVPTPIEVAGGEPTILLDEKVAGKNYDRQVQAFDMDGVLQQTQRFAGGRLVQESVVDATGSVTSNWNADGSRSVNHTEAGKLVEIDFFNAAGVATSVQKYLPDGGRHFDYFAADGVTVTRAVDYLVDGSRFESTLNLTGRDYVQQSIATDASGKQIALGRFDAEGRLTMANDLVAKTTSFYSYADGALTGYRVNNADGTSTQTRLAPDGSVIATDHKSPTGVVLRSDQSDPAPLATSPILLAMAKLPVAAPDEPPVAEDPALAEVAMRATSVEEADGAYSIALSLTGTPGMAAEVRCGGEVVCNGVFDENGRLALTAEMTERGSHVFVASIVDGEGTPLATSDESLVLIDSAQELGSNAADADIVYLADAAAVGGAVADAAGMTFSSMAAVQRFLRTVDADATAGMSFKAVETITGRPYDQQATTLDASGAVTRLERFADGQLTFAQSTHGNARITNTLAADGGFTLRLESNSVLVLSDRYDASGNRISHQVDHADGSRLFEQFDAEGEVAKAVFYHADGGRTETTNGITGRDYVSQTMVRDAGGKLTAQVRYDADGNVTFATDPVAGANATFQYGANGELTAARTNFADRSYAVTAVDAEGTVLTSHYTARGLLTGQDDRLPLAGVIETVRAAAEEAETAFDVKGAHLGGDGSDRLMADREGSILDGGLGDDVLTGGVGDDLLIGGMGADVLTGGEGNDVFLFTPASFGNGGAGIDGITDFAPGDRIDLSTLSSIVPGGGLSFIGAKAFGGHAGEVQVYDDNRNTFVAGDLDGDGTADFVIQIDGHHQLGSGDLLL